MGSSSSNYAQKLLDPRWQKKRLEILSRDEWTCQKCSDTQSTLHVHHLRYERGKEPWEYDNCFLITLCETCHENEADRKQIEEDLLDVLASKGFLAGHLFDLLHGFSELNLIKSPGMTSSILEWVMANKDVMNMLKEQFDAVLRSKRLKINRKKAPK